MIRRCKTYEEFLIGGKGDNQNVFSLAILHKVSVEFMQKQLERGIKHEMEHTFSC